MPRNRKLTDSELVAIVTEEISQAEYQGQSELSAQRSQADLAYTGQYTEGTFPTTGMSSVLVNTLQPAVDTLTTYLTKLFCSDRETVVFTPKNKDLFDNAQAVSEMVNDVIHKDNRGYEIINRWIKDSLLHKNGIVKVVWDSTPDTHKESFEGTEEEFNVWSSLKESKGYEVKVTQKNNKTDVMEIADEFSDEVLELSQVTTKYIVKIIKPMGKPNIINIAPEEFLINEGATSINDDNLTRFVCHKQLAYVSDIIEMFPKIKSDELSTSGSIDNNYETEARGLFDGTFGVNDNGSSQDLMRQVEVSEVWIKMSTHENGKASWQHIFVSGNTLLMQEDWFGPIPMCSFSPFPVPHKFYGLGLWDKLKDYHKIKTALVRSEVDSGVQRNTIRIIADPRMISTRDLKSGRPGIIKAKPGFDAKSIVPLNVGGGSGSGSVNSMLQYVDKEVMAQIGIDPVTGMVSTDIEKSGNDADKTSMTMDNASTKVEMMAREFAETGLRDLIWSVTDLLVQQGLLNDHQLSKSDLKAKVGLGHQTSKQKLMGAQAIIQQQVLLESNPSNPVSIPAQYKLEASAELTRSLGYEDAGKFFPKPEEVEEERGRIAQAAEAQQAQNIQMQELQMQQQSQLNETTMQLNQAKAQKAQVEAQSAARNQELTEELAVKEIDNIDSDNELNIRRVDLEQARADDKSDLDQRRLELEIAKAEDESSRPDEVTHK